MLGALAVLMLSAATLPVFKGYEDPKFQRYDKLIVRLTDDFNRNRGKWIGGTAEQAAGVGKLDPALVKAFLIQETGGNTVQSRAAWKVDPAQVNVPGDWSPYKKYLGLRKPRHRNEGTAEQNIRAAIMFLARKGFGVSGQPAANRPAATFDEWDVALERYNGRTDKLKDGTPYREHYAGTIIRRAEKPQQHIPIERTNGKK